MDPSPIFEKKFFQFDWGTEAYKSVFSASRTIGLLVLGYSRNAGQMLFIPEIKSLMRVGVFFRCYFRKELAGCRSGLGWILVIK